MARPILNINQDFEIYFETKVPAILQTISGNEQAKWGIMTSHHMLEHLAMILEIPLGKIAITLITPEEDLPKVRAFLFSEYGLTQNFKFPLLPKDDVLPLKTPNIETAKIALQNTIQQFLESINEADFTMMLHPFFGKLNREEWLLFQFKHFSHHFMQFGLIQSN